MTPKTKKIILLSVSGAIGAVLSFYVLTPTLQKVLPK